MSLGYETLCICPIAPLMILYNVLLCGLFFLLSWFLYRPLPQCEETTSCGLMVLRSNNRHLLEKPHVCTHLDTTYSPESCSHCCNMCKAFAMNNNITLYSMSVNNSVKYTSVTKASECPQYRNIVFILCTIYNLKYHL